MSCAGSADPLDLERGLPTTARDVAALHRTRQRLPRRSFAAYLAWLTGLAAPAGRSRLPGPDAAPFRL